MLLDTGSAVTIFKTDDMMALGIVLLPDDRIRHMAGVGGNEIVVEKQMTTVQVGNLSASPFTIQMGAVDYGILMDGILGLDFLLQVGACIDLHDLEIRSV
jgi:hypothetical protein